MTERKAIEWFENRIAVMPESETKEMFCMAISALKKQEADRWHSVAKEGNPKKSGLYIVTDNSKMDGNKPHTRWFNAYGKEEFWSGWGADKVVVWKEITSEPYEAEEGNTWKEDDSDFCLDCGADMRGERMDEYIRRQAAIDTFCKMIPSLGR